MISTGMVNVPATCDVITCIFAEISCSEMQKAGVYRELYDIIHLVTLLYSRKKVLTENRCLLLHAKINILVLIICAPITSNFIHERMFNTFLFQIGKII